jgi:hypothetical protein
MILEIFIITTLVITIILSLLSMLGFKFYDGNTPKTNYDVPNGGIVTNQTAVDASTNIGKIDNTQNIVDASTTIGKIDNTQNIIDASTDIDDTVTILDNTSSNVQQANLEDAGMIENTNNNQQTNAITESYFRCY